MRWISDTKERTEVGESSQYASVRSCFIVSLNVVDTLTEGLYCGRSVPLLHLPPKYSPEVFYSDDGTCRRDYKPSNHQDKDKYPPKPGYRDQRGEDPAV